MKTEERRRLEAEAATGRAEENERLSLAALESIFDALAGPDRPPPGPGPDERTPEVETREANVLACVLSFYDRFAARNETNPRLALEAARSWRRVGMIRERMEQPAEARAAFERSRAGLEELIANSRGEQGARARAELAATLCESVARVDGPSDLPAAEARCQRAILLLDGLAHSGVTEDRVPELRVRARARLASLLSRGGRVDEARAAVATAVSLRNVPGSFGPRPPASLWIDLAKARMDLADALLPADPTTALSFLDAGVADLDAVGDLPGPDRTNPKLRAAIEERRAKALRALGREDEAREAERRAREARRSEDRRPPPPRDR